MARQPYGASGLNTAVELWPLGMSISTKVLGIGVLLAALSGWAMAEEAWLALGLLIIIALAPVFVRWPVVSTVGVYALLVPFENAVFPQLGGSTVLKPIGALVAAVLLATGLIQRRLGRPPQSALWLSVYVVWAAMSAAWALEPDMVFRRLPTIVNLFALYVVAVSFRPSRKEVYVVCVLAVVGGAIAAGVGYTYGMETAARAADRGRLVIAGQEGNPNALGQALILPLMLALAGCLGLRHFAQRMTAIAFLGVIAAGVYISMSRGALIAVVLAISVLLYRVGPRKRFLVPAVTLFAIAGTMPALFYERVGRMLTGEDATGSGRLEIWEVGAQALKQFGVFGAGLDNFVEVHRTFVVHGPSGYGFGAHNTYLMLWVELGVVGLTVVLAALGSQFLAAHRARKVAGGGIALAAVEAAAVGMLVFSFFGDTAWNKDFWLVWMLLAWATSIHRRESDDEPPLVGSDSMWGVSRPRDG